MALANGQVALSNGTGIVGTANATQLAALSNSQPYGLSTVLDGDPSHLQRWETYIRNSTGWYCRSRYRDPTSGAWQVHEFSKVLDL